MFLIRGKRNGVVYALFRNEKLLGTSMSALYSRNRVYAKLSVSNHRRHYVFAGNDFGFRFYLLCISFPWLAINLELDDPIKIV